MIWVCCARRLSTDAVNVFIARIIVSFDVIEEPMAEFFPEFGPKDGDKMPNPDENGMLDVGMVSAAVNGRPKSGIEDRADDGTSGSEYDAVVMTESDAV